MTTVQFCSFLSTLYFLGISSCFYVLCMDKAWYNYYYLYMQVFSNHSWLSPLVCGRFLSLFGECDLILFIVFIFLPDSPSVTIQRCSTLVTEGDNVTMYVMLVIANVSMSESGSYQCLAWNGIGNSGTKSCTIAVQCKLPYYLEGLCDWVGFQQ